MTIITPDNKLADVVLRNYHLIPVINRFGIELGFGDKKISEICRDCQIDADFFAALLNTISYESYFSDKSLNASNTLQLIDYLKMTLANYQESQLNVIEIHIRQLSDSSPVPNEHLRLIENFFAQFKTEFRQYTDSVNKEVFKPVTVIYEVYSGKEPHFSKNFKSPDFDAFQYKTGRLTDKLSDMKSLLVKYLTGTFDRRIRNAIIYIIARFEVDIHNYMRLQYRLLKPMTKEMQAKFQS
ncbi:MAG: hypothetical protein FWF54_06840 [Candidatus Azobacteroides sp.]|nr:hypothetical protein [Candidatus Azobacteroides sp.]